MVHRIRKVVEASNLAEARLGVDVGGVVFELHRSSTCAIACGTVPIEPCRET